MLGIGLTQLAKYEKGQSAPSLELLRSRGISTANHKAQHVVLDCNYKSSYHVASWQPSIPSRLTISISFSR